MDPFSPLHYLQNPIWVFDVDNKKILWANDKSLRLWEATSIEELLNRDLGQDMSAAAGATLVEYQQAFKLNKVIKTWWRFNPKKITKNMLCLFSGIPLDDGRTAMLVEVIADESSLRRDLAFSDCSNLALLFSSDGKFISANDAFSSSYGNHLVDLSEFIGDINIAQQWLDNAKKNNHFKCNSLCWTGQRHHWFDIEAKWLCDNSQLLLQLVNVTKDKEKLNKEKYNAEHDFLTGLMNRRGVSAALKASHHRLSQYSLLFLDLDGFKLVNDTYGHAAGDKLLRAVAIRLLNVVKDKGLVARFGGDEFIIQIERRNYTTIGNFSNQIIETLNRPFHIKDIGELSISCSIGTSNYPDDANNFDTLVTQADMAMHRAKQRGRNCSYPFLQEMADALYRKMTLRHHLSQALENQDFELYYQPIIDLSTQQLKGFEALIRWYDESLGQVSPAEFIPLAEETGQIVPLGLWILHSACQQLAYWTQLYKQTFIISINLSRAQLQPNLAQTIEQIINQYNVNPSQLALEITESAMLQDYCETKPCLDALAAMGIELYLDDFGTGYSSLSQLHDLPISTVKLDQSFVQGEHTSSKVIIEATKAICEKLNLKIVAEGVETQAQLDYINQCGFDYCQGYFFSKPMPVHEIEQKYFHIQLADMPIKLSA
ncbi:diguanylate phosphodiesterase [Photobacterium kishitanii]|uniref:Bifunctional diguanylate cyclase/phosphodiesterase n=3 Tax=Photobacterium kishitanii TaxID=318456 RepID=A0AAX0Z140_9GAMM|nr:bifunctional diguanylate cyclase/phosphodiesterase [Photobacterium kishitanii]KJG56953.1 diguanylate phosphodiesterase [Photobacterium kishitanii]KJG66973.1 diguanylate phosphodiesterase [Photobacterium kishitanii]KJG70854.1 diguanylate phosphodiesterase [Photobacterium kishitanii]OBU34590.1 diguanylate phosphodiesterase [Photobacterium kishitanii]PSW48792.1 bifunctional diguanylate cyclase/phosphodiesterase [Photobacterium kishitanii]